MEIRKLKEGRYMVSFNGVTWEGDNLRIGILAVYEGGRK